MFDCNQSDISFIPLYTNLDIILMECWDRIKNYLIVMWSLFTVSSTGFISCVRSWTPFTTKSRVAFPLVNSLTKELSFMESMKS